MLTSATEESENGAPTRIEEGKGQVVLRWAGEQHLELPPSQDGVQDSYTLGATEMVRHAGAAPAPADWKTAMLAVTPMTLLS